MTMMGKREEKKLIGTSGNDNKRSDRMTAGENGSMPSHVSRPILGQKTERNRETGSSSGSRHAVVVPKYGPTRPLCGFYGDQMGKEGRMSGKTGSTRQKTGFLGGQFGFGCATKALWSETNMNRDVSTGTLARPFARLLAPLTRSLAPDCSLRSRPTLLSLIRSRAHFAHSLAGGTKNI